MGFPDLFSAAKKAVDDVQAGMMGETWLAEVKEEGEWKDMDGWKDQYEPKPVAAAEAPKKEDSEMVKDAKANARNAAIEKGAQLLQENIVYEMMKVLLECSCKVIGTMQEVISKDTEHSLRDQMLPLLAALNAILLSYRFDKTGTGDTNKFKFIRKEACGDLTTVAFDLYQTASDDTGTGKSPPERLVEEFHTLLGEDQKNNMRAICMTIMEDILKDMANKVDPDKADQAKDFLGGSGENNVLLQFLSFLAVSKLEVVRTHLLLLLDEFLQSIDDEMKDEKPKSKEEIQVGMLAFAESKYQQAKGTVDAEVSSYMDMLKNVLLDGGPSLSVEEANAQT